MMNLVLLFVAPLQRAGIRYAITGSIAGSAYGEPRLSNDVDIVIDIAPSTAAAFEACFPAADFYCPPEEVIAVEAQRTHRGHFNVIHHDSGFKADMYPKGNDALQEWALTSARRIDVEGTLVSIAPPEYVIVRKLEYHREGGSQKHVDDIANIVRAQGDVLDAALIEKHAARLGLDEAWRALRAQLTAPKD
jgi:hypothetical protein